MTRTALMVLACLIPPAAGVSAQDGAPAGRFEVGGGITWVGRATLGPSDATETTPQGTPSPFFNTSSTLAAAPGVGVHVGVRITRRIEADVLASVTKPVLRATVSGDIETSATVTASETISQYTVGGGVIFYLPYRLGSPKLLPFVSGSAAYLRQLHGGNTLVVTGQMYQLGGGVKYLLGVRDRSWLKAYGVRADAGLAARVKGVAFDAGAKYSPSLAASLFARF
ncbi:MAG TPA: hypothetical protein VGY48_28590 [Vicinamibacterales bacterium]|jgi:hypothetical protein|nr:hypothetical protein [Vicinamibacterales bacterium]